jgi:hypothetical protein
MIYVLYSNDYELCLGGNHLPEEEVLLQPTELMLKACENIGAPLTLFADVACFWRYRELGLVDFPNQAEAQLQDALRRGHDVQAHLHPHWQVTGIERKADGSSHFAFELRNYLLGNWEAGGEAGFESWATAVLGRCRSYLEELLRPVRPDYACRAFRAGGYGLQPRAREFIGALLRAGFLVESSIVPGEWQVNTYSQVDFRRLPRRGNFHLSATTGLEAPASSGLFEIPIPNCPGRRGQIVSDYVNRVFRRKRGVGRVYRGYGVAERRDAEAGGWRRLRHMAARLWFGGMPLGLSEDVDSLCAITQWFLKGATEKPGDVFFSLICHSKSEHPASIEALCRYHERMAKHYGRLWNPITFRKVPGLLSPAPNGAEGHKDGTS